MGCFTKTVILIVDLILCNSKKLHVRTLKTLLI